MEAVGVADEAVLDFLRGEPHESGAVVVGLTFNRVIKGADALTGNRLSRVLAEARKLGQIGNIGNRDEGLSVLKSAQHIVELLFEILRIDAVDNVVGANPDGDEIRLHPSSERLPHRLRDGVEIGARNTEIEQVNVLAPILELIFDPEYIAVGERGRADTHRIAARIDARDGSAQTDELTVAGIVDRIGAGDAFAAGILHGLRSGLDLDGTVQAGLALACLKHSLPGDASLFGRADIDAFLAGERDVRR